MTRKPTASPRGPLFGPTYNLVGYCLLIGVFGGFAALFFEWVTQVAQHFLLGDIGGYIPPEPGVLVQSYRVPPLVERWWLPVVTTLGGLVSGLLVFRFAPEAEGHGTDAAIASYHQRGADVRPRVTVIKTLASAFTIGSGGVAGREGPTAQITVGLGGMLARFTRLRGEEKRILLLASMAAGLAAMFQAPLGMAIFAVEILYAGMVFESEALIYTVISAVTAYAVRGFFDDWKPIFEIPAGLSLGDPTMLVGFAVLGVAAGLYAAVLPTLLYGTRNLFIRLPGPPHYKPALGGLLVGLAGVAVPSLLGTGYGWVELGLAGQLSMATLVLILLFKGPAMALTIGSGGSGGVFAPTITMGAMLGLVVGSGMAALLPGVEIPISAFTVVGMASVFGAAARTPLSTLIMVAEMTAGYGLIVPAMLANILAYLVQRSLTAGWRYPTLYISQVERREDSPAHRSVFVRRALTILEGGEVDASELTLPRLVSLLRYGEPIPITHGEAMLLALRVEPHSPLDGGSVSETVGKIAGATAVAILRAEEMLVPRGPTQLQAGDQLIAVATPAARDHLRQAAGSG